MGFLVLHQSPNGGWYAADPGGAGRHDNIAGWQALEELLHSDRVAWDSPNSLSRFRAQFGEPPDDAILRRLEIVPSESGG